MQLAVTVVRTCKLPKKSGPLTMACTSDFHDINYTLDTMKHSISGKHPLTCFKISLTCSLCVQQCGIASEFVDLSSRCKFQTAADSCCQYISTNEISRSKKCHVKKRYFAFFVIRDE